MKLLLIVLFVGFGLFAGGFFQFTHSVSSYSQPDDVAAAEAIVVLTGGSTRIATALDLLAEQKGKRLLISGVNASTKMRDLRSFNPTHSKLFDCCVDMEKVATDTIGNAVETAKWIRQRGYKSLIVVTSAYHMPRSLVEFKRQLPDIELESYAVPLDSINENDWWKNADTLRFMLEEYVKYIGATAKDYVNPQTFQALRSSLAL